MLTDLNKLAVRLLRESGLSGQDIFPRDFHGRENLIKIETNTPFPKPITAMMRVTLNVDKGHVQNIAKKLKKKN